MKKRKGNILLYLLAIPTILFPPAIIIALPLIYIINKKNKIVSKQILFSQVIAIIPYLAISIAYIITLKYFEIIMAIMYVLLIIPVLIFEIKNINKLRLKNKKDIILNKTINISFILSYISFIFFVISYVIYTVKVSLKLNILPIYISSLAFFIISINSLTILLVSLIIKKIKKWARGKL